MESEIRIVKLERETLAENDSPKKNVPDEEVRSYFATDYFNSLSVTKKLLDTPLADIMDINKKKEKEKKKDEEKDKEDGRKTSVQSYTMYFSQNMWQRYEENYKGNGTEEVDEEAGTVPVKGVLRGDPFEKKYRLLPYISIIQVHLTPEILRRTQYGECELWEEKNIILEPFLDDLYDLIGKFDKKEADDNFIYRVYQVLSAGDLAVVIKSGRPETSYKISSKIRQRAAKESENTPERWALYKTYTVLAIEYQADLTFKGAESNVSGEFVVRGCYSSKYWGEGGTAFSTDTENIGNLMSGLNGRYDFSMNLSMEEFAMLYPIIRCYKGRNAGNSAMAKEEFGLLEKKLEKIPPKVKYLAGLLKEHCLSYINERYLPDKLEPDKDNDNNADIKISLRSDVKEKLSDYNEFCISKLLKQFNEVKDKTIQLRDAHKNLEQYFNLMERQIASCYTINQVSDTRVYVPRIAKQLGIALDAIDIYREIIVQENNTARINLLVDNIKDVVHMLDSYMEYIRNNNLQSLQTPNYNIESSMSMEKILIGYNEYLGHLIIAYHRVFGGKTQEEHERKYFPIVIPDLHYMDISVRGLFLEGIGFDWAKERKIRKDKGNNDRLIIVESPTLAELGDIPVFMALLFHEIAHQFRYENRKTRNKTLLNLLVDKYVSDIAFNMAEKVCWDICASEVQATLQRILERGLKGAVFSKIEACFNQDGNKEKWDAPLMYFKEDVLGLLDDFSQSWSRQMDMEGHTVYFIKSLQKNENLCSEYQFKYIEKMKLFLDKADPNKADPDKAIQTDEEWKEIRNKLVKYAFIIAGLAACGTLKAGDVKGFEWMWEEKRVEDWLKKPDDEVQYEDLWDELREALSIADGDRRKKAEREKTAFDNVCRYYQPPADNTVRKSYFIGMDKILEEVYRELCKTWKVMEEEYARIVSGEKAEGLGRTAEIYRSWSLVGRYLGIDYDMEDNQKKFSKLLRNNNFTTVDRRDLEQRVAVYREVTADMFMYIMMKMTPFTYLNLMASIIPAFNLEGINLERIVTVLYIMTGKDNGLPGEAKNNYLMKWKLCGMNS